MRDDRIYTRINVHITGPDFNNRCKEFPPLRPRLSPIPDDSSTYRLDLGTPRVENKDTNKVFRKNRDSSVRQMFTTSLI